MRHKRLAERNIGIDVDPKVISAWTTATANNIELLNARAEDVLARMDFLGSELIYSDPPYHPDTRKRKRVYKWDYSIEDHERLISLLASLPCMVLVSGYANDLYKNLLGDWKTKSFSAKTHQEVREETIWFNFEPPELLHDGRYLGDCYRERETTKRRLQRLKKRVAAMKPAERGVFLEWINRTYPLENKGVER